ncbi:hypothetical protein GCM10011344_11740 [Dokdonia pacifica]|uniref:Uncharacterized protein n=1 Tax=Dokdonia pacifica TaxID=1627892 RepID=A0A238YEZ2_9FLAO|nr:DUF6090 family protein [Dokdonia pacifica]GGG12664.1 hypothetical protein GCM10011344_11740 [Dokdonia pacifica]SNR69717.1 hypothetical protein SAMN06265376_10219 [Dokdonia pacifica]
MKKGIKGFLLYGIREIVFVVIGILIAVSINNANESRKSKKNLEGILTTYKEDLKIDTLTIGQVLNVLEQKEKLFTRFLSDTVTIASYEEKPVAFGLVLSYTPFQLQKKGIRSLEGFESSSKESDSLVIRILANHSIFDHLLNTTHERIGEDIDENMYYLKTNHPWIGDLLTGKIDNPEMLDYYMSKSYRARLAIHYNLVYKNLQPYLQQYQITARKTLEDLDKRLQEE